jgi:hypothetical protein
MLAHLQALTWQFYAGGEPVWALSPYAEPEPQPDGTVIYRARRAAETGDEGAACVDDAARAVLLSLAIAERAGFRRASAVASTAGVSVSPEAASGAHEALLWAERWLSFVRYMQLPDGRFANFVLDAAGRRNLRGVTSVPGGLWWTGRALWALARYHRLTQSTWALEAIARCPIPDLGDAGKTLGLFALAGMELVAADPTTLSAPARDLLVRHQGQVRPRVEQWCEQIIASGPSYFRDSPGRTQVPLWGYHQLHAVASAATLLGRGDFIPPCIETVRSLVEPVIAARGMYWFDPTTTTGSKEDLCAYCLSPLMQGLATLYDVTAHERYRVLALDGAAWLYGRNDAGAVLYDPVSGRCADGLAGPAATIPSKNFGAESAIEAGFMELGRRRLAAVAGAAQ